MQKKMSIWEIISLIMFGLVSFVSGIKIMPKLSYDSLLKEFFAEITYTYTFADTLVAASLLLSIYLIIYVTKALRSEEGKVEK